MLKTGKREAYVTFTESQHAYAAYAAITESIRRGKKLFTVLPADTWVQPSMLGTIGSNDDDDAPLIFQILNDDCIRSIFRQLDHKSLINVSEVCQRFQTLAKPFLKTFFSFNAQNVEEERPLPLAEFRLHLKHVGANIRIINIDWNVRYKREQLDRIIAKMVQYLNPDALREMHFRDVVLTERHFQMLWPLRKNLINFGLKIHRASFACINQSEWNEILRYRDDSRSLWTKVHEFLFNRNNNNYFDFCVRKCAPFDSLTFIVDYPQQIAKVARIEPEVRQLTIVSNHPDSMTQAALNPLRDLFNLDALHLYYIDQRSILDVCHFLHDMPQLKSLTIQMNYQYTRAESLRASLLISAEIAKLGSKFKNLETFVLHTIPIQKITLINFISRVKTMKSFHLHFGEQMIDEEFIEHLGYVRQRIFTDDMPPLELWVNPGVFEQIFEKFQSNEFIKLKRDCKCHDALTAAIAQIKN